MENFLEWMLESSLLVLLVLGIRRLFLGRVPYVGIYALWLLVMVRFLVPVNVISTPFSIGNIISEVNLSSHSGTSAEQGDRTVDAGLQQGPETYGLADRGTEGGKAAQSDSLRVKSVGAQTGDAQAAGAGSGNESSKAGPDSFEEAGQRTTVLTGADPKTEPEAGTGFPIVPVCVWLVVSCLLFLCFVLSNGNLLRKLKRERVRYRLPSACGPVGIEIYTVTTLGTPCLYGFFRPAIYLPAAVLAEGQGGLVKPDEIEQMIVHEYVHYQHRDHIWAMVRIFLLSLYWFHPLLWLAVSRAKKDAELACDASVIHRLGEERRFDYGSMLLRLAGEARFGDFRYTMLAMSRKGREMEGRIRAISGRRRYPKWIAVPMAAAVLIVAGITCTTGVDSLARGRAGSAVQDPGVFSRFERISGVALNVYFNRDSTEIGSKTARQAFQRYIETFTEAVNTGKTDKLSLVLATDRKVYAQQCALVKNYHKRGIREEVLSWLVSAAEDESVKTVSSTSMSERAKLVSKEKIRVFYGDETMRVIRQRYQYTCERINHRWIITDMEEING